MPIPMVAMAAGKLLGGLLKKKLKKKMQQPAPPQLPSVPSALSSPVVQQLAAMPNVNRQAGNIFRQLTGGRELTPLPGAGFRTGGGFGGDVVPFQQGGPVYRVSPSGRRIRINPRTGKAIRRINPANGKAAVRAVRRVAATHKLLKKVEKAMRKACGASGRRVAYRPAPEVRHFARKN